MRRVLLLLPLFLLLALSAVAVQGALEGGEKCQQCGMSRSMFSYTRMLIGYRDGTQSALCSLHCAAVDLAQAKDKKDIVLQVADYDSKKLIPAETAVWVMGGSKPGVMTGEPKWAFASRAAAQRFVKEKGGSIVTFQEAMQAASREIQQDAQMLQEYHEMKGHQGQQAAQ